MRTWWGAWALALWACGTTSTQDPPPAARVRVLYPQHYGQERAAGATVELGGATQVTNDDGEAVFSGVSGTASLTARKSVSSEESLALTGHAVAVDLSVTQEVTFPSDGSAVEVRLEGPMVGGLVIKQVYYTGAPLRDDNHYFHDQFVEVFNNGTQVVHLDGLLVADLYGAAGNINPNTPPTPYQDDPDHVYAENVWRIPGTGTEHPLQPGESVVLAHDGTNHQPDSTVDLSGADWEAYNRRSDNGDQDYPTVPNLDRVHFSGGFDWLMTVFGPSVVIFRVEDTSSLEEVEDPDGFFMLRKVPVTAVIDAVDILMDRRSLIYKRVPPSLDEGFTTAGEPYTGKSVRRKVAVMVGERRVLQDTGNSTEDFERLNAPTPWGF